MTHIRNNGAQNAIISSETTDLKVFDKTFCVSFSCLFNIWRIAGAGACRHPCRQVFAAICIAGLQHHGDRTVPLHDVTDCQYHNRRHSVDLHHVIPVRLYDFSDLFDLCSARFRLRCTGRNVVAQRVIDFSLCLRRHHIAAGSWVDYDGIWSRDDVQLYRSGAFSADDLYYSAAVCAASRGPAQLYIYSAHHIVYRRNTQATASQQTEQMTRTGEPDALRPRKSRRIRIERSTGRV